MGHQVQQLLHLGLERQGLLGHGLTRDALKKSELAAAQRGRSITGRNCEADRGRFKTLDPA